MDEETLNDNESLSRDLRRMRRGNVSTIVSGGKTENAELMMDIRKPVKAHNAALKIENEILKRAREGTLTQEALESMNNKIRILNEHMPDNMEVMEVPNSIMNVEQVLGDFEHGGNVPKTGLYRLHEGERVIPAKMNKLDILKKSFVM